MKFWWSFQILPVTSPPSTSRTSIESIYSGLTTSMNGTLTYTHIHSDTQTDLVCLVAFTNSVCVFVFSGQRGFRRSRRRLKNFLRRKRKKGKRPIKVCLQLPSVWLCVQCDDLWMNCPLCVFQPGLWRRVELADSLSPSWRLLNSRPANLTVRMDT